MGIKQLFSLISEHAPEAVKTGDMKTHFGRKVAVDASMSIYSFLIAVRSDGQQLTNESGETTSHLMGLFYRTLRLVDQGIKPVYVFDGRPPKLKTGELAKRTARKAEAAAAEAEARETGTAEDIEKFSRRTVRVTREHNEECRRLLRLMGVPYVIAPTEAEAQCAALARDGLVYGAASEDMDTLTFGTPVLLRHMMFSEQRKEPIQEIRLPEVLRGLDMSMEQFIDLCILLGCDYVDPIKGVGPTTALKLIREHKSLDKIVSLLRGKPKGGDGEGDADADAEGEGAKSGKVGKPKYQVPEEWPFEAARELFFRPDVIGGGYGKEAVPEAAQAAAVAAAEGETKDDGAADPLNLKWGEPDEDGLVQFLVREKGFSEDRVRSGSARLLKAASKAYQSRLDGFFSALPRDGGGKKAEKKGKDAKGKGKGKPGLAKVMKRGKR